MPKENPKDKIQDDSPKKNTQKRNTKVDHETENKNGRDDIIDKKGIGKQRDNLNG